jgi:hypothetical protein
VFGYICLVVFILFAVWFVLLLAKTNELLGDIKEEIGAINKKIALPEDKAKWLTRTTPEGL